MFEKKIGVSIIFFGVLFVFVLTSVIAYLNFVLCEPGSSQDCPHKYHDLEIYLVLFVVFSCLMTLVIPASWFFCLKTTAVDYRTNYVGLISGIVCSVLNIALFDRLIMAYIDSKVYSVWITFIILVSIFYTVTLCCTCIFSNSNGSVGGGVYTPLNTSDECRVSIPTTAPVSTATTTLYTPSPSYITHTSDGRMVRTGGYGANNYQIYNTGRPNTYGYSSRI